MPKFSQRYGYTALDQAFQREGVDKELRTRLWNILKISIWNRYDSSNRQYDEKTQRIDRMINRLWFNYFNNDMDNLPSFHREYGRPGAYAYIKDYFFNCEWFEVYDLLEELTNDRSNLLSDDAIDWINGQLEQHNAAYRFVGTEVMEVTDKSEIKGIEEGLEDAETPVRTHLEASLRMLSDRETPDYRNSIKESISAVEAACRLVSGNKTATLGDALKKVKNLHPALAKAFAQLYGYTSDAAGVRHSLIDESNISYADAKFMLVTCSAFISYLKATTEKD